MAENHKKRSRKTSGKVPKTAGRQQRKALRPSDMGTGKVSITLKKFALQWGPAIFVMGLIIFFSSLPMQPQPPSADPLKQIAVILLKKSGHLLGYALLALALQRGLCLQGWKGVAATLGCVLLFALSDEFHQSFVYGRNSSLIDVGIDLLGASFGLIVTHVCGIAFNDVSRHGKVKRK